MPTSNGADALKRTIAFLKKRTSAELTPLPDRQEHARRAQARRLAAGAELPHRLLEIAKLLAPVPAYPKAAA